MGSSTSRNSITPEDSLQVTSSQDNENHNDDTKKSKSTTRKKIPGETSSYPPTKPSTKSKDNVITSQNLFEDIDKHVLETPKQLLLDNFRELLCYLTEPARGKQDEEENVKKKFQSGKYESPKSKSDLMKVRAIYCWITSLDLGGLVLGSELPPENSPMEYLAKIKWNMNNHAHLFALMCRMAYIPCVVITGVNKSAAYELGSPVNVKRMAAQWNAVFIQGQWMLVDTFWSSVCIVGRQTGDWTILDIDGEIVKTDNDDDEHDPTDGLSKHQVNEFYFLTDPEKCIMTHFPADPQWQLMKKTWSLEGFENYVYLREMFWNLGIKLLPKSKTKCLLTTEKGELDLEFKVPASHHLKFRYMLYMSGSNAIQGSLDRFVFYQKSGEIMKYAVQFPITGTFKLDIFGYDQTKHESLDLVCSYRIECPEAKANCQPLPDNPDIGWGPGEEAKQVGLVPKTHEGGLIYTNDEGMAEIKFDLSKGDLDLHQSMLTNKNGSPVSLVDYSYTRREGQMVIITIRVPFCGQYALKLFANEQGKEGVPIPNVCNYLIQCDNEKVNNPKYPSLNGGLVGKTANCNKLSVQPLRKSSSFIKTKDSTQTFQLETTPYTKLWAEVDNIYMLQQEASQLISHIQKTDNSQGKTSWQLDVKLPRDGEYAVNVYAENDSEADRLYNVINYLIIAGDVTQLSRSIQQPSKRSINDVVKSTNEQSATILFCETDESDMSLGMEVTRPGYNDGIGFGFLKRLNKEYLEVGLPVVGKYRGTVFIKTGSGSVYKKTVYRLKRDPPQDDDDTLDIEADDIVPEAIDPDESEERRAERKAEKERKHREKKERKRLEKKLRKRLQKSLENDDHYEIQAALEEFENKQLSDETGLKDDARKTIAALLVRDGLTLAMNSRKLKQLDPAIDYAEQVNHRNKLNLQLAMATRIQENLRNIEKLRHDILALDQRTISEIRSYNTPPDAVREVMYATFLMLGNSPAYMTTWKAIQALIGKSGKEGLKRRVGEFRVDNLDIETGVECKKMLTKYSLPVVRDVSSGVAAFYVWAWAWLNTGINKQLVEAEYAKPIEGL